jgi:hypothetical protein
MNRQLGRIVQRAFQQSPHANGTTQRAGELQVRTVPLFLAVKMSVPPGVTVQIGFGHPAAEPGRPMAGWNGNAGSGAG